MGMSNVPPGGFVLIFCVSNSAFNWQRRHWVQHIDRRQSVSDDPLILKKFLILILYLAASQSHITKQDNNPMEERVRITISITERLSSLLKQKHNFYQQRPPLPKKCYRRRKIGLMKIPKSPLWGKSQINDDFCSFQKVSCSFYGQFCTHFSVHRTSRMFFLFSCHL